MAKFIEDKVALPFPKNDGDSLSGSEWTRFVQNIDDLRSFEVSGTWKGFKSVNLVPNPGASGSTGWMWVSGNLNSYYSVTSSFGVRTKALTGGGTLGWFDITDYGAKGDGVTDDGPAIFAAINDAIDYGLTGSITSRFAKRAGTVYIPPCASGSAYNIITPVSFLITQAGTNGGGALHFRIIGNGADSPIKVSVGSGSKCFDFNVGACEWFQGHIENLFFVSGNPVAHTHSDCSSSLYVATSVGTWNIRDINMAAVWAKQSPIHLAGAGHFHLENIHDSGCYWGNDAIQNTGFIFLERTGVVTIENLWSYGEYNYNGFDDASGGGFCAVQIAQSSDVAWGPTTVSIKGFQSGVRNTYAIANNIGGRENPTYLSSLSVEDFHWQPTVGGIYADGVTNIQLKNGDFQAGTVKQILELYNTKNATLENVTSIGTAPKILLDSACRVLKVKETALSAVSGAPCGVVMADATSNTVYITKNGIKTKVRRCLADSVPILSGTLVRPDFSGSNGVVSRLGSLDDPRMATGVAYDSQEVGLASYIRVAELAGQQVTIRTDGSGTIKPGFIVTSSTGSTGRCGSTVTVGSNVLGVAVTNVTAGTPDFPVDIIWGKTQY